MKQQLNEQSTTAEYIKEHSFFRLPSGRKYIYAHKIIKSTFILICEANCRQHVFKKDCVLYIYKPLCTKKPV